MLLQLTASSTDLSIRGPRPPPQNLTLETRGATELGNESRFLVELCAIAPFGSTDYVALLFEPPRLVEAGIIDVPARDQVGEGIRPLLLALRKWSAYLPNAAMLHVEAVHRMVRLGFTADLVDADVVPLFQ